MNLHGKKVSILYSIGAIWIVSCVLILLLFSTIAKADAPSTAGCYDEFGNGITCPDGGDPDPGAGDSDGGGSGCP